MVDLLVIGGQYKKGHNIRKITIMFNKILVVLLSIIVLNLLLVNTVFAALTYHTGFEMGDTTEWASTHGTYAIDTTTVHSGAYSLKVQPVGSYGGVYNSVIVPYQFSFWFYVHTLPDVTCGITGSKTSENIRLTTTGYLQIFEVDTQIGSTGTTQLQLDTWYRVSLSINNSTKAVVLYLNGLSECNGTYTTSTSFKVYGCGITSGWASVTAEFYYDDSCCSLIAGSSADIGDIRTLVSLPSGAGTIADFDTRAAVAEPNEYQNVDDVPGSISDLDYNAQLATSQVRDTYATQNCAVIGVSGTVQAISTYVRMRTSLDTVGLAGATVYDTDGYHDYLYSIKTIIGWYNSYLATMPHDSAAWTNSRYDDLSVGAISTGSNRDTFLYAEMVMVAFLYSAPSVGLPFTPIIIIMD